MFCGIRGGKRESCPDFRSNGPHRRKLGLPRSWGAAAATPSAVNYERLAQNYRQRTGELFSVGLRAVRAVCLPTAWRCPRRQLKA